MRICFFSKYPPIEGGVSSGTYWLAKGLGEAGHEVHIVTNSLGVEERYREKMDFKDHETLKKYQPKNVFVHSIDEKSPVHIPYSPEYLTRLINLGLKVIRDYDCDVIDSYYFLPYGLAAMFVKMLTGKPLVVRHAGSDLVLINNENFNTIFLELFKNADFIVSNEDYVKEILKNNKISPKKMAKGIFFGVNQKEFSPNLVEVDLEKEFGIKIAQGAKIVTYIGKYLAIKGLDELIETLSGVDENFFLLIITEENKKQLIEEKISHFPSLWNKYFITGFVPPWKIPWIIKRTDCMIYLENNFPGNIHVPIIPLEAFSIGTPLLLSSDIFNKYKNLFGLKDKENVFAVNPGSKEELFKKVSLIIKDEKLRQEVGKKSLEILPKNHFEEVIRNNEKLYKKAVSFQGSYTLIQGEIARLFKNFI